jgi:hypothetical protein
MIIPILTSSLSLFENSYTSKVATALVDDVDDDGDEGDANDMEDDGDGDGNFDKDYKDSDEDGIDGDDGAGVISPKGMLLLLVLNKQVRFPAHVVLKQ